MDSKEVLIKPEETINAAERRTEAEARAEKEVENCDSTTKVLSSSSSVTKK